MFCEGLMNSREIAKTRVLVEKLAKDLDSQRSRGPLVASVFERRGFCATWRQAIMVEPRLRNE
jgi:hypothetical protein